MLSMYGMDVLKPHQNSVLNQLYSRMMNGYIAFIISGIVPYVSSKANNNGVDAYIEATKGTRVFENCISLANSGSVGTAFYEPFAFVASDHVTSLQRENTSQYVYLFLTAVLEQQKSNFDFNREISDLRIKKMRVMLPVDDNDEPDYNFMEECGRKMMTKKYIQYLNYLESTGAI